MYIAYCKPVCEVLRTEKTCWNLNFIGKKNWTGFQQETRNKNFGYLTKNNKKYV